MANKPRIRFKGFTEDWEQRKLNDFGIATGGTSLESEFVDGGNYKVISIGSYSEESVYNDQGLRVNKSDKTKSRILNKNDLTMILNDKTASGNIIGRVLLIDQDNTYVYNQRTERIEVDRKNFLPIFLYHMLNAPEQRKYIVKASQGNTQIYVNWSAISNINYMIPQLLIEQEKIAYLFSLINKDITLHQCKLEKLKLTKKALLQKLFPKNGKHIPEIRFKGFTDTWEQRKLDELTISIGDGLHGTPKYDENGSYYFINGNNLVDSKVSVTEETKKVAFEALSNDDRRLDSTSILMSINGTIGTLARYNNENIMLGKSVAYITPKNINRDFLFYQLQGNVIQSYFYKNLTGTTIKNLGLGTIKNAIVMSTLSEEESKIGKFFYKLDQYITLHQRKLERLQEVKKGLLQKMFV